MAKKRNERYISNLKPVADERREMRRRRRIKNTILAYAGVIIFLAILVIGIIIGLQFLFKQLNTGNRTGNETADTAPPTFEPEEEATPVLEPTEEPIITPSPEEILDGRIAEFIGGMTLEEKISALFIITPDELTGVKNTTKAGDVTKDALLKHAIGGLILFDGNISDEEQLTEMIANMNEYTKYPLFISVDEEGGSVSRVASKLKLEKTEEPSVIGASGNVNAANESAAKIGEYLSRYGFNLDFAPVADLATDERSGMKKRSYGSESGITSDMVAAAVRGLQGTGVSACLKHFPGIGSADGDMHEGSATIEKSFDELSQSDLKPYEAGIMAGADFIMVSHVSIPAVTGDSTPASLSSTVITDMLRSELGFNGIVITDALNMQAVDKFYTSDEAALKAVKAGADMLLMPKDFKQAYKGLLDAVNNGEITAERIDESLLRIYRVKSRNMNLG